MNTVAYHANVSSVYSNNVTNKSSKH